jgi:hypothetical protein
MADKNDVTKQDMSELIQTIKDHPGLSDLDIQRLTKEFKTMLEDQQKAILEATPVRKGELQTDTVNDAVEKYQGRYKGMIKNIVRNGEHREGGYRAKAIDLYMAKLLMEKAVESKMPNAKPPSVDLNAAVKALSSTGSGTGDELVPTGMAGELWQDFFAASRIVNDLPSQPMPSDPFDVGLGLGDVTWRKGAQSTATTASDTATAKSTLTSTEQVTEVDWSYDLDEDAVIAMMPALRQRIGLSGGEQMDAFALNADATNAATGNINLDDADPADDSYYITNGQDGIRHQFLVDNTGQGSSAGAAIDDAKLVAGLLLMGKYGLDLANCRIVPDIATYFKMLALTNVATVEKYGPQATVLTGELGRYRGIPIIPSASMPLTEADGKVSTTAGNNVKGQISIYNRNFWRVGFRRGLTIEVDRLIQKRQLIMVVSFRIAIGAHGTRSTAKHTAGVYNIT